MHLQFQCGQHWMLMLKLSRLRKLEVGDSLSVIILWFDTNIKIEEFSVLPTGVTMSLSNHVAEQSSFLQLRTEPRFNLIDHHIDHVGRILHVLVQKAISHLLWAKLESKYVTDQQSDSLTIILGFLVCYVQKSSIFCSLPFLWPTTTHWLQHKPLQFVRV